MPKGVEHQSTEFITFTMLPVLDSVMPKGVEHYHSGMNTTLTSAVLDSVMPKGVEHLDQCDLPDSPILCWIP